MVDAVIATAATAPVLLSGSGCRFGCSAVIDQASRDHQRDYDREYAEMTPIREQDRDRLRQDARARSNAGLMRLLVGPGA